MSRMTRASLLVAATLAALGLACGGTNPATSDWVVTCVGPSTSPWAGDGAATPIAVFVARNGGTVSGVPVRFTASSGAITADATTDVTGVAHADFFPSAAAGVVAITVEAHDGAEVLGSSTCSVGVQPSFVVSAAIAAGAPATQAPDVDCDLPVLLDIQVRVDLVVGVPASVPTGLTLTGHRVSWRRPDGTGTPGVDVPGDYDASLSMGPNAAPTSFDLVAVPLHDVAQAPALACGESEDLVATVTSTIEHAGTGADLTASFTYPVTFTRSCNPCP